MTSPRESYSGAQLRAIVYMAAGIGTAAIMKEAPNVVMPTEELGDALDLFLAALNAGEVDLS